MVALKTGTSASEVEAYLGCIEPAGRQADARALDLLFRRATGFSPDVAGGIVGYGRYAYTYESGHSGETCATGFAVRKANIVIYVMPGFADFESLLGRLGKHKVGKSCLYLTSLSAIDSLVLEEIIRTGLANLATRWSITPD